MKLNLPLTLAVCCFLTSLSIRSSEANVTEAYAKVLQEYEDMMMTSHEYGSDKRCSKNFCGKTNEKTGKRKKMCYCDKECEAFGDCCLSFWGSCNSSFEDAYVVYECMEAKLKLSNTSSPVSATSTGGYQVIKRCPKHYKDSETRATCESPRDYGAGILPFVQGDDEKTYRNRHCASCHGITTWTLWKTELKCPVTTDALIKQKLLAHNYTFTDEEREIIRESCEIVMLPPNNTTPLACDRAIECSDETNPYYKTCFAYKLHLYSFDHFRPYRNPHCAKCSNDDVSFLSLTDYGMGNPGSKPSLAILFDFNKASDIYGLMKPTKAVKVQCEPEEIYDFTTKECRRQRIAVVDALANWTCPFHNETFPNSSEYIVVSANRSVFVPSHNRSYGPSWYRWHDGNITVCGNLSTSYLKTTRIEPTVDLYTSVEYYFTLVGFSFSILALLIVLLTYALFGELRTLPGKIVINLAIALLLSQVVFLYDIVEDVSGDTCRGIAVVLHYLYIAAFCWMNAMAFDVSRTFAGKSHRSQRGSRRKVFLFCLLYAWGVPLIIVGITLAVNHTGTLDVGYGNAYYCWLTNPVALAVCFAAPVVLMLLFNVIALIRIVVAVRRVRKVTKKVRDESSAGQDVGMCGKLTAVFGITWLLGLGAGYHIALRIIYIICNSLQGVFIMVGFIMTKRILNLYLKKSGQKPLGTRTASQSRSTALTNTVIERKKSGTASLIERRPKLTNNLRGEDEEPYEVIISQDDSAETQLIAKMEGPETKL